MYQVLTHCAGPRYVAGCEDRRFADLLLADEQHNEAIIYEEGGAYHVAIAPKDRLAGQETVYHPINQISWPGEIFEVIQSIHGQPRIPEHDPRREWHDIGGDLEASWDGWKYVAIRTKSDHRIVVSMSAGCLDRARRLAPVIPDHP